MTRGGGVFKLEGWGVIVFGVFLYGGWRGLGEVGIIAEVKLFDFFPREEALISSTPSYN